MRMNIKFKDLSTKGKVWSLMAIFITIAAIVGFVLTMHFTTVATPKHTVENGTYIISGSYGKKINLLGASISLTEDGHALNITYKNNGASARGVAKGAFTLSENNETRHVYLNMMNIDASFYIKIIDADSKEYYVSCATLEETKELYNLLMT